MATFTETIQQLRDLRRQLDTLTSGVTRRKDLGNGYTLVVYARLGSGTVDVEYRLEGPDLDINNIPLATKRAYFLTVKKVEDWKSDLLADFPTL